MIAFLTIPRNDYRETSGQYAQKCNELSCSLDYIRFGKVTIYATTEVIVRERIGSSVSLESEWCVMEQVFAEYVEHL